MSLSTKVLSLVAPLSLLAIGGCAAPFSAKVARFSAMPAPQGQTFTIQARDPRLQGGLEFSQYASLVAARLEHVGYQRASGRGATLVVTIDYDVDHGRERVQSTPGAGFGFGVADYGFYRPWYGRYGGGFRYGFYDPWAWGGGFGGGSDISSYTVYTSELKMDIERTGDGQRLFEGTARAVSRTDDLPYLVPNLVEAMFTGFPGNSGETVKITIPPPDRRSTRY